MTTPSIFARITKVDEVKRLVYGRAIQEVPDKSDEIFDYTQSKPYFEEWSKSFFDATDGKSYGNIRAMHGKVAAGKIAEPLAFSDTEKAIDIAAKITDDNEWNKVLDGVYTGFSIGGSYVGDRVAEKIGDREIKRYTAKPAEISIVDSPCVTEAKFFSVVKADGAIEQRAFKPVSSETAKVEPEPIQVEGTDEQVIELGKLLNVNGLKLADAIRAVAVESMLDTVEAMEKREFSADERKSAAKSGKALPDGSFPIENVSDLHNAVQAYGRAKDKAKTKAHIIARAKALGATKELPDAWTKSEKYDSAADDELIKGALSKPLIESDSDEAFSSNVAAEVKAGKPKDQAVAIAYAVQRKARNKKVEAGELKKGMWNVSRFADCLETLAEICRSAEYDLQSEGDDSPLPMKLRNWLEEGISLFTEMSDEESSELLQGLKEHAGVGEDDEIEYALEASMKLGTLRKRINSPELPVVELVKIAEEYLTEAERKPLKSLDEFRGALLAKVGSMSAAYKDKIQAVHDHASDMGAECNDSGEKVAPPATLEKGVVTELQTKLDKALVEIEALKKQPMPHHVYLRTLKTVSKEEDNGSADVARAANGGPDWVHGVPYNKLIKLGDGSVDWDASRRANQNLKPADV